MFCGGVHSSRIFTYRGRVWNVTPAINGGLLYIENEHKTPSLIHKQHIFMHMYYNTLNDKQILHFEITIAKQEMHDFNLKDPHPYKHTVTVVEIRKPPFRFPRDQLFR